MENGHFLGLGRGGVQTQHQTCLSPPSSVPTRPLALGPFSREVLGPPERSPTPRPGGHLLHTFWPPPEKRPRAGRGRLTPLAVLNSPSGQARQWKLVGAMQMGALISCPRTVVRVSTCDTSLRYQGRRRILRGRQRFSAGGTALRRGGAARRRGLWVAGAAGSSCGPLGHPWRVGRGQHGQQEAPPPRKRLPGAPSCAPVVPPAPPTCPGGPGYPSSPDQTLSPRLL